MKKKALFFVLLTIGIMFLNITDVSAMPNSVVQVMSCNGVLGNVHDKDSVAWLLQKILDYARVIGPFLVLILSSLDYVKVILTGDDDGLNKSHKKLITRLILAGVLFVLPTLVSVLLNVLGFTSHEICGLK